MSTPPENKKQPKHDKVDEAAVESFPASDPPAHHVVAIPPPVPPPPSPSELERQARNTPNQS